MESRFYLPTRILFGSGVISRLRSLAEDELGGRRPFLVTDAGLRRVGIADRVLSLFPGIPLFDAVEPNPRHTTVNEGGEAARRAGPDIVIGLGGGSALDAAKAVALLATNPGRIEDYEGKARYRVPPLPVLAVPTTCGTGSEVTWVSVITHTGRKFKMSIKGPAMFPAAAVVDPDLLMTLPAALVASTGMDALTHALEAFTVKPATFVTDALALQALRLIFSSLEAAFSDIAGNRQARENLMKGSLLAGMAFGNSDVGAVHCLAEAAGSLYDTAHGAANAAFLPVVMEYNIPVSAARYAEVARLAGIDEEDDEAAARKLVRRVRDMSRAMGLPFIHDLGIGRDDLPLLAEKSAANNSNPSNPRPAGKDDYQDMLTRNLDWA